MMTLSARYTNNSVIHLHAINTPPIRSGTSWSAGVWTCGNFMTYATTTSPQFARRRHVCVKQRRRELALTISLSYSRCASFDRTDVVTSAVRRLTARPQLDVATAWRCIICRRQETNGYRKFWARKKNNTKTTQNGTQFQNRLFTTPKYAVNRLAKELALINVIATVGRFTISPRVHVSRLIIQILALVITSSKRGWLSSAAREHWRRSSRCYRWCWCSGGACLHCTEAKSLPRKKWWRIANKWPTTGAVSRA